ncbi:MAG: orotidine-5'-phosphate decarboxylase [Pirellulales bacterium]|nr:orotidine-5'-phosphate decarboxylase [Pirellulales bacterium]
MENFSDRLAAAIHRTASPVCVGLDPRAEQLPAGLLRRPPSQASPAEKAEAYAAFCREVIDAVAGQVPVVKPQSAFFEQLGSVGLQALAQTIAHARGRNLLVVLDAKRNDIGTTAEAYAQGLLGDGSSSDLAADALTVSPYLGHDSLLPFVEVARAQGCGLFVLAKTSNPGGAQFQDLEAQGQPLYRHVAAYIESLAAAEPAQCGYGIVGAVAGATYPEQLAELRAAMPHTWLLVPGYGAQGGTAADVAVAFGARGLGAIVNNSRGLIFAASREPYRSRFGAARWQDAVAAATRDMADELRAHAQFG